MRSLLPLLLLPSLLHSALIPFADLEQESEDDQKKPERFGAERKPYTLCPVGSIIDWRSRRVASLAHVTIDYNVGDKFEKPKEFDHPFTTVEYGRTCVMTLGFTARESRPILAYVGTAIPALLETTMTGYNRLTREPRRDPLKGQIPDMAVFYSKERVPKGNCVLHKNAQHIRYGSTAGFYFVVCYGNFERLINDKTKSHILAAADEVFADFASKGKEVKWGKKHKMGLKWHSKELDLHFLDPIRIKKRMERVMTQMHHKPPFWTNPTEFEGWSETVMPHYDLRTVMYESRFEKVRTEADAEMTARFFISTALNILQCILMEKFYLLLRKYLL